jgi:hypothetical protein
MRELFPYVDFSPGSLSVRSDQIYVETRGRLRPFN